MYRLVEHSQNDIGRFFCAILPEGLKPSFRKGEPIYLSGKLETKEEVLERLNIRLKQLKMSKNRNNVCLDIEEVFR